MRELNIAEVGNLGEDFRKYVIPCDSWCHYLEVTVEDDDEQFGLYIGFTEVYQPEHWFKSSRVYWRDILPGGIYWGRGATREGLGNYWAGTRFGTLWRILRGKPIYLSEVIMGEDMTIQLAEFLSQTLLNSKKHQARMKPPSTEKPC
jgi:hypothetical protein